jgi:hypothetical protein
VKPCGSFKNIPLEPERSKSKDPYNLKFHKKKPSKGVCKENLKDPRKTVRAEGKSKSHSKEKLQLKSSLSKRF